MKKITILALHLGYGGVEQYISSLCKMLDSEYKIEIISTYKISEKPLVPFSKKVKIKYLIDDKPNKEEFKSSIHSFNIKKIFKEAKKSINILYLKYKKNIEAIKNIDSDYIITTRIFHNKLVSKFANKKIIKIATEHNYHNNDQKYVNSLVKSCKNFDYFIAVSKELYNYYEKRMNARCVYIPNVIDKIPKNSSNLSNNTIISIGRLSSEKGFSDLISVVDLVRQHVKDIKLHLIGDGALREYLEKKIKDLKLENNIIMHGYLDKKEIEKYMLDSSIYVMTSLTESFGLVLIEAMSYGLPLIAFDSASGARELINKNNGILVENRDRYEMARSIINLLKSNDKKLKLGANGKKTCEQYLAKNVKKEWLNLLK